MKKLLICILVNLCMSSSIHAGWSSEIETDAMTDEETLIVIDSRKTAILCSQIEIEGKILGNTAVGFFVPENGLDEHGWIQYRFDTEPADKMVFVSEPDYEWISFYTLLNDTPDELITFGNEYNEVLEEIEFIKNMMEKSRLLLRVPTEESYVDIEVDLIGVSEHLNPKLEFCGLKF